MWQTHMHATQVILDQSSFLFTWAIYVIDLLYTPCQFLQETLFLLHVACWSNHCMIPISCMILDSDPALSCTVLPCLQANDQSSTYYTCETMHLPSSTFAKSIRIIQSSAERGYASVALMATWCAIYQQVSWCLFPLLLCDLTFFFVTIHQVFNVQLINLWWKDILLLCWFEHSLKDFTQI